MRRADFVIHREGVVYLKRWFIIPRNRWFNIYLHQFCGDDEDRALHDHPWWSWSVLLAGRLLEHLPDGAVRRIPPWWPVFRGSSYAHRLALETPTAWTLFITGPRSREWGFHCPNGWRLWTDFVDADDPGKPGRGCE